MKSRLVIGVLSLVISGCSTLDRLSHVGEVPPLSPIENPIKKVDYQPVSLPMPVAKYERAAGPNSLWRSGARGFFKDQRARQVGDVLTINVTIADSASLSNKTSRNRTSNDDLGLTNVLGLESLLGNFLPGTITPSSLVDASSSMTNTGSGGVDRVEAVDVKLAAIIIQKLPNGNLVVAGRQEIRVNYEVREILVTGIVRPEDITTDNNINHEKIAELRVAYGGRGHISDVQQSRYGAQILDVLLPY